MKKMLSIGKFSQLMELKFHPNLGGIVSILTLLFIIPKIPYLNQTQPPAIIFNKTQPPTIMFNKSQPSSSTKLKVLDDEEDDDAHLRHWWTHRFIAAFSSSSSAFRFTLLYLLLVAIATAYIFLPIDKSQILSLSYIYIYIERGLICWYAIF